MLLPDFIRIAISKLRNRRMTRVPGRMQGLMQIESLEQRSLLTTFLVTSTDDAGTGTLRSAIDQANDEIANPGRDLILFDPSVSGATISLSSPDTNNPYAFGPMAFVINSDIVIDGQGANVTLDGNTAIRIFGVLPESQLAIRGLTVQNGLAVGGSSGDGTGNSSGGAGAGLGGAIFNAGNLIIYESVFQGNNAIGGSAGNASRSDSANQRPLRQSCQHRYCSRVFQIGWAM